MGLPLLALAAISIGMQLVSKWLTRLITPRAKAKKEKFEFPRAEEGAFIPVVFGVGEIAPNIVWFGNVRRENITVEDIPRTLYYANMIGMLCHGPVDELVDLKFGDKLLSMARPGSAALTVRARGGTINKPPAVVTPMLPIHNLTGDAAEIAINAPEWFGHLKSPDGRGGIVGLLHMHWGEEDDVVCGGVVKAFGARYASAFPKIAYLSFPGEPICVMDVRAVPSRWMVETNPSDGIRAGGGWAEDVGNPFLMWFGSTLPECAEGWHGVFIGDNSGRELDYTENGDPIFGTPNGLVIAGKTTVCAGCTQAYLKASYRLDCLRGGDKVTVRFKWRPVYPDLEGNAGVFNRVTYHGCGIIPDVMPPLNYEGRFFMVRWPHDQYSGGANGVTNGAVSLERNYHHNDAPDDPDWYPGGGWSYSQTYDNAAILSPPDQEDGLSGGTYEYVPGDGLTDSYYNFEWQVTVPAGHDAQVSAGGTPCYLSIHHSMWWRAPWFTNRIWDIEIDVETEGYSGPYSGLPAKYQAQNDGLFYWGTEPTPPALVTILRRIPTPVSGAGILSGANPADCIYEVLTDTIWGMGLPATLIDLASFQTAATTLANEKLQVSLVVGDKREAQDILDEFLAAIDGVIYFDPITAKAKLKLVRPDYDISLVPTVDESNARDMTISGTATDQLVNEVRVNYRRYYEGGEEDITNFDLGPGPYTYQQRFKLPGSNGTWVTVTQGANTIDPADYLVTKDGILSFYRNGTTVDWDGSTGNLLVDYKKGAPWVGFVDAVASASNQALYTALGEKRSETVDLHMLMDEPSAQQAAERILLQRSRPLKTFRWNMTRQGDDVYPGCVVKVNWPLLELDGVPVRITAVDFGSLESAVMQIDGVEDKWGFQESALIFEPWGDRPPLNFDYTTGTAPTPVGMAQIGPSDVTLQIWPADDTLSIEVIRVPVADPDFVYDPYAGYTNWEDLLNTEGIVLPNFLDAKVTYTLPPGTTTLTDYAPQQTGTQYYYYVRHVAPGMAPSAWLGPLLGTRNTSALPPASVAEVAPLIEPEWWDDYTAKEGVLILWIQDPQLRLVDVTYRTKVEGGEYTDQQYPSAVAQMTSADGLHLKGDGWTGYQIVEAYDQVPVTVEWTVSWGMADGTHQEVGTVTFPHEPEMVWTDEGEVVHAYDPSEQVSGPVSEASLDLGLITDDGDPILPE